MRKKNAEISACLQPSPKVLVSCRGKNGEDNALAVAYCCNCSFDPPMLMVGIVPSRYSYDLIKESGCFVVNIPTRDYQETFDYLGSHSKRNEDKLARMNVQLGEAKTIDAPVLTDCPVHIECKIVDSIRTGSHEMFVGQIQLVQADETRVDAQGQIDFSQIDLL